MHSYYIIGDAKNSLRSFSQLMLEFDGFICQGNSVSEDTAMNTILKHKPDLVFLHLDNIINEPFKFVRELNTFLDKVPNFVAISSTHEHAYKAIKHSFIDYLMHPTPELEVRKLILKYQKDKERAASKMLCLQSYKDFRYINTDEILFLKADNNTTDFYINNGNVVSAYKTLKIFENTLPENFVRIHKSYIVNKNYVSRINYGKYRCSVTNTTHQIPFTRTYIDNIDNIKNTLSEISVSNLN